MVLRELFVALGLEVDEASFAKGQLAASLVEKGLEKLVDVAKEVVESFVENAKEALEYGDKIKKLSQSVGIASDALQELQYAGELADLSAGEMAQSIGILSRKMQEAKKGGEEAGKAFKGIKFQEGGKLLSADEVLGSIADKFKTLPDGAEKTALAMQLFGRAGKQMIPLLNKGSEELDTLRQEARDLGLVMGEDATEASEELNDNLKRLHEISRGLWRGVIGPLIPAIGELVKRFLAWRKANAAILAQRLRGFIDIAVRGIHFLGETLGTLIKTIGFLQHGLTELERRFHAVSAAALLAAGYFSKAWFAALAPFAKVLIAVGTLLIALDDLRVFLQGGDSVIGRFQTMLQEWMQIRPDDPWFIVALKDFIALANDAIEKIKELSDWLGISDKVEREYNQARLRDQRARTQAATTASGKAVTLRRGQRVIGDLGTLGRGGTATGPANINRVVGPGGQVYFGEEAIQQAAPMIRGPQVTARGSGITQNNSITINANNLNHPERLGPILQRALREHAEEINEETAAHFPAVP